MVDEQIVRHGHREPGLAYPRGKVAGIKRIKAGALVQDAELLVYRSLQQQAEARKPGDPEPPAAMILAPPPREGLHLLQVVIRHTGTNCGGGAALDIGATRPIVVFSLFSPASSPSVVPFPSISANPTSWLNHPSVTTARSLSKTRYSPRAAFSPWLIAAGKPLFEELVMTVTGTRATS